MFSTKTFFDSQGSRKTPPVAPSRALEWLWQNLREVKHPHILDCGPAHPGTIEVLLKRGSKLYISDLIALARESDPKFVRRLGKTTTFLIDAFLENIPPIPPDSLSVIAGWHLLDLLPREAIPGLLRRFWSYLRTGGVLFCLLREPSLANGAGTRWWLDSLMTLRFDAESKLPFPYPVLTNRDIEQLVPGGNVKTFLTRSARREIVAIK
jgi:hypothetical protein